MVTLFCVIVGEKGSAFGVDIDASESVGDLKDAIAVKRMYEFAASKLQLFLGKTKDGTWLDQDGAEAVTFDGNGYPESFMHMDPFLWIKNLKIFGENFEPNEGEVHVLVVVPEVDQGQRCEERAHKKARTGTTIEVKRMNSIADTLDIDSWQTGGIELDIHHIEPDFPRRFYVRKETQHIIKIFLELKLSIVFVGSPGVGKSILVVLFAFYKALRQQKIVILLRNQKTQGLSMLYLDGKNKVYWRRNKAKLNDLSGMREQDFELCLDGFMQTYITNIQNCGNLESFRVLATSGQYNLKNNEFFGRRVCLVPFWSKSDLNKIGGDMLWTKSIINEQYYYSGGNLRDFLFGTTASRFAINQAVAVVCMHTAELLSTQYTFVSASQVDCLRMTTIKLHGQTFDLQKYLDCDKWLCVITSEYVLRKLGHIVTPSYYEDVLSKSCMLGDNVLMGIAFKNYVHTMARDGQMLKLQMRLYDRKEKQKEHTYSTLEFKANSYLCDGNDAAACETIMQQLADVDYWYPCTRSLETIDSVAKLNMGGEHKEVGLIQITKSDSHKIDAVALDRYAAMFTGNVRYIALVPNKETSDKFQLSPANPPTKVPLYIAYVTDWRL